MCMLYSKTYIFIIVACTGNCDACNTAGPKCDSGSCKSGYYYKAADGTCPGKNNDCLLATGITQARVSGVCLNTY